MLDDWFHVCHNYGFIVSKWWGNLLLINWNKIFSHLNTKHIRPFHYHCSARCGLYICLSILGNLIRSKWRQIHQYTIGKRKHNQVLYSVNSMAWGYTYISLYMIPITWLYYLWYVIDISMAFKCLGQDDTYEVPLR